MVLKPFVGILTAVAALFGSVGQPRADEALTIRIVRPEEQGERFLALFRGARVPDPAAALAAWKRATGGKRTLGKPLEAALAALNPAMLREWKSLDGAEVRLDLAPETGRLGWRATVPKDDGSVAAFGSALALTDGGIDEPLNGVVVLRLGPPGSSLAATRPGLFALASTRDGLRLALESRQPPRGGDEQRSGWYARLDPSGLRGLATLGGRRFAEGLNAVGCRDVRGSLSLDDETLALQVRSALEPRARRKAALDPSWLDVVPASGTLAAISVALDTGPEALAMAFAVLDRIERVDPTHAGVAPLRTRFNVLASAARVRPETDVWPRLKGVSAAVLVDPEGQVSGAVVALHAVDSEAAERIAADVLPRLASTFVRGGKPVADPAEGIRALGAIAGKPVSSAARGRSVLIGWGESALSAALAVSRTPEHSQGRALRNGWSESPPQRAGGFWPGRLRRLATPGSALARALNESPPILWQGRTDERSAVDVVHWAGLRGTIRRVLDALPLGP